MKAYKVVKVDSDNVFSSSSVFGPRAKEYKVGEITMRDNDSGYLCCFKTIKAAFKFIKMSIPAHVKSKCFYAEATNVANLSMLDDAVWHDKKDKRYILNANEVAYIAKSYIDEIVFCEKVKLIKEIIE